MTVVQMVFIIFSFAFTGWFISWLTCRLLFSASSRKKWGIKAGLLFQSEFESSEMINEKISDPLLFEKLKPEIETHVDFFLGEKLATIFPLLYKFMGEKTLLQFKNAFMVEIDLLFPVIIKNYMSSLKKELRLDTLIAERVNNIPVENIRRAFFANAKKEILYFKFTCILTGLLSGLLTILALWVFKLK